MEINYTVKGQNKSLILLHGWGGSHLSMDGLQECLAQKGFLVFNLDLPGFGKTSLTSPEMDMDDYAQAIEDFIEEKNIFEPIIVGHSFGGKLAIKLALRSQVASQAASQQPSQVASQQPSQSAAPKPTPNQIAKIVLINSSGIKPKNDSKRSLFSNISTFGKKVFSSPLLKPLQGGIFKPLYNPIRKFYYYYIVRERDYFNAGEKLQKTFININSENFDELLSQVLVPTLIIWGADDKVTPLWMGEKLKAEIAGSKLIVVENAKHNLPIISPEIVSEIIYNNIYNF
jgi:pimeloyl-ACP methyl ester carboxylesterase